MIYKDITQIIGQTPMVRINKLNRNKKVSIYAKLEGQNPGGSIKDRIALSMIKSAEESGELTRNKTILEPTSGNTGIGLALIAAARGYGITLTMSKGMSYERKTMLKSLGAKLIETPAKKGTDGAIIKAQQMLKKNPKKYWMPNQFNNPANPQAHYQYTAQEIINDLPDLDVFVAGIGTSGTLMGVGGRLRGYNRDIRIIGVEPEMNHKIAGLKNMKEAIVPEIFNERIISEKVSVNDNEAYNTARELALKEGLFVGMSSGASMLAALKISEKMKKGNIVVIFSDRGEKYLSTNLFNGN